MYSKLNSTETFNPLVLLYLCKYKLKSSHVIKSINRIRQFIPMVILKVSTFIRSSLFSRIFVSTMKLNIGIIERTKNNEIKIIATKLIQFSLTNFFSSITIKLKTTDPLFIKNKSSFRIFYSIC